MNKDFALITLFLALTGLISGSDPGDNEKLWQKHPGNPDLQWESQVFHLGNGYFGVSAYCGVKQEKMTLAEFSVTSDNGGKYTLRYREKTREISLQKGETFRGESDF